MTYTAHTHIGFTHQSKRQTPFGAARAHMLRRESERNDFQSTGKYVQDINFVARYQLNGFTWKTKKTPYNQRQITFDELICQCTTAQTAQSE